MAAWNQFLQGYFSDYLEEQLKSTYLMNVKSCSKKYLLCKTILGHK